MIYIWVVRGAVRGVVRCRSVPRTDEEGGGKGGVGGGGRREGLGRSV